MKNLKKIAVKRNRGLALFLAAILLGLTLPAIAQDEEPEKKVEKLARPAFESAWWFDGQTGVVYDKNTLEFVINHRFGLVNSGNKDLFGLYGPSNIRLGLAFAPIQKLNVGIGYTKNKKILDLFGKYAILTQTRSNSMPITLTYHVNMGIELLDDDNYLNSTDRYNYFHQLLIMKRFSRKFSAQLAPSLSHYNAVKWQQQDDGSWLSMDNDTWSISAGVRYKVTAQLSIMLGYDQPLTQHAINQPKPSINLGVEIATSNHAFQVFVTNNNRIQPQENFMFNQNDFLEGQWLIGFNITRLRGF
jgi:Membrane bound beta barrel domain (DUF5777)